ncbi:hypothetical protein MRS44_013930 [Fusarium solani]|uniref:uncharacterized protein n=1 Tax=Fusarium solani TaxID=169388 RepID=UPI0032C402AC|nr:hypothetical protein MRS44_013930 [Fusarium solani]
MKVRLAIDEDIPALKEIALAGLSNDLLWQYCFPSRTQRATAEKDVEHVFKKCLHSDDGGWILAVAETPKTGKVVSFAIWQTIDEEQGEQCNVANQIHKTLDLPYALDHKVAENITVLLAAIIQSQQNYLTRSGRLMFLHAVITHPHWRGKGYAKLLCKHSLQLARVKGIVVVALASPFSGYVFYSGNGFASCGYSAVEVEGHLEKLELQVMAYTPPPAAETRRSSLMDFLAWGERKKNSA